MVIYRYNRGLSIMAKNNKNDNINYYEILVKLEEAKTSVENIDEQNYTIALLKAKELIFKYDILKDYYKEKIEKFNEKFKTQEYEQEAYEAYEEIKSFIEKSFKKNKEFKISYSKFDLETNTKDDIYNFYKAEVKYKKDTDNVTIREYHDLPKYYIYSSIGAYYINEPNYNKIKCFYSLFELYNNEYLTSTRELTIRIPEDLEYFICSLDLDYPNSIVDTNVASIVVTAMVEVLFNLTIYIRKLIEGKYDFKIALPFDIQKNKKTKKHVIKWKNEKNTSIFVDNKQIIGIKECFIEDLRDILKDGRTRISKQRVCVINTAIKKAVNINYRAIKPSKLSSEQRKNYKLKKDDGIYYLDEDLFVNEQIDYDD